MVVKLDIKLDQKEFLRALGGRRDQLRFAMSFAINDVANVAKKDAQAGMKKFLHKPVRFTTEKGGAYVVRSSKDRLVAEVGISDRQWEYLKYQVKGGTRPPDRRHVIVPVAARLNVHGNMKRTGSGTVAQWAAAPKSGPGSVFFGVPKHHAGARAGVWQRVGKGKRKKLKMLAAFQQSARYQVRLPFFMLVKNSVRANWHVSADKAIQKALKTAK